MLFFFVRSRSYRIFRADARETESLSNSLDFVIATGKAEGSIMCGTRAVPVEYRDRLDYLTSLMKFAKKHAYNPTLESFTRSPTAYFIRAFKANRWYMVFGPLFISLGIVISVTLLPVESSVRTVLPNVCIVVYGKQCVYVSIGVLCRCFLHLMFDHIPNPLHYTTPYHTSLQPWPCSCCFPTARSRDSYSPSSRAWVCC
jgi:hypothetical protein